MNARLIGTGVRIAGTLVAAAAFAFAGSAGVRQDKTSRAKTVFTGKLPVLDGQRLAATILEVTYPPGGANPAHRHPCPVIGYVLTGAIRLQLKGQNEKILRAGETFFESPADVHAVSANASQSEPARFLAYFVCDRETPLSVPLGDGQKTP